MSRPCRITLIAVVLACACRTKPTVDQKVSIDNGKVSASVTEHHPGRIDLRGPGGGISLMGLGPHGAFDVDLAGVGLKSGTKPLLAASPDGEMLALAPEAGEPWIVFYLTPRRRALSSDYEHPSGALASLRRTRPAGPSVDWSTVPKLMDVATDIAREGHPSDHAAYLHDVFGEVRRRGGEPALVQVLAATSDLTGADTKLTYVSEEVCRGGASPWLRAYRALPIGSRKPVDEKLEKALATPKLDAEIVLRAGLTLPLENKAMAPAMASRVEELAEADHTMADVARAVLLRRLVFLDSKLAADVGCRLATRRYADPPLKRPSAEQTEQAALLAIAFAKRSCPAVAAEAPSSTYVSPDLSIADEAKDSMDDVRKRAGNCVTGSPSSSSYLHFAKQAQASTRPVTSARP